MNKLEGIIFDLDSTLVDVDLDFDKIKAALNIPNSMPILEYLEELTDLDLKAKLHDELLDFELQAARNKVVISGVLEVLEHFNSKGIRLAVLTRNCKEAALLELEGFDHYFFPIFSREDNSICKPMPNGLLNICNQWKVDPANTIMIGDYLFDLKAGHAAGSKTIWFNNPKFKNRDFSNESDLNFSSWEFFLENLDDILCKLELRL